MARPVSTGRLRVGATAAPAEAEQIGLGRPITALRPTVVPRDIVLANNVWPRSGGDRRNSSRVQVVGPSEGRIHRRLPLPQPDRAQPERLCGFGGIAVAPDRSLRVAKAGMLTAMSPEGDVLWSRVLLDGRQLPEYHSAPVALQSGAVVITLQRRSIAVDARGHISSLVRPRHWRQLDDSGPSPNLTRHGALILICPTGDVAYVRRGRWQDIGVFGYAIVPPAVYDDGSLAIAGYSYKGLCRVRLDGTVLWQTPLRDADLLPTLNDQQVVAVGSLNDHLSAFFASDGQQVGNYRRAACFAEYVDGGWIALSKTHVARLTSQGRVVWEQPVEKRDLWRRSPQPVVDSSGRAYVAATDGLACFGANGTRLFALQMAANQLLGLSIVAEGTLACIVDDDLLLIV